MLCLCFIQRGLSKNVSHHGWSTTKNVKITLAKTIYSKLNEWLKISYFEFSFRFSSRKSQNQQKLAKKINYLKIQFRSKNLTYFMNFNSLKIVKIIPLQHSQKPYSLNFSSKNKNKKHTALFLDAQELHSQSTWKANDWIFLTSVRNFMFQRRRSFLSGLGLNNFFKTSCCLGLIKS